MEFRLYYRGRLKGQAGADEKHTLRKHFHKQLSSLWSQLPLTDYAELRDLNPKPNSLNLIEKIRNFNFVPLVSAKMHLTASLDILFLRPETPGSVVTSGGDLDNRVKTLLDALKVPHEPTALPKDAVPDTHEEPFYTLLQDDALVTSLSITADRLLEPPTHALEALVVIHVKTSITRATMANIGL